MKNVKPHKPCGVAVPDNFTRILWVDCDVGSCVVHGVTFVV